MRITWYIEKKRGNLRPKLTYSVVLEGYEKELALPYVRITSTIPEPPSSWQPHCHPGEFERSGAPAAGCYELATPSHLMRNGSGQTLRLPWREDNAYPEVDASFQALREAFEEALATAHASEPMDERGELVVSPALKRDMAPAIMADRLLRLAK
ncbi:conserved hypothetical protein [Solidesulfovibrio fructosivorans JJ]]|uniref:Uncharacterized protein n=1 Tax=Solidesulfovibrio fructosivorans JJ] TaxID=596151 RepID=E1JYZ3_SOLFR|nr:hypothetical protein [Solidesulfovibrio fructosivorans]EFL50409.1 conserved hypothetical protein [Solidesulfovibrio fructosivorans JJ]]